MNTGVIKKETKTEIDPKAVEILANELKLQAAAKERREELERESLQAFIESCEAVSLQECDDRENQWAHEHFKRQAEEPE